MPPRPDHLEIMHKALESLPADVRNDFVGVAFEKALAMEGIPFDDAVIAVGNTLQYQWRKERVCSAPSIEPMELPAQCAEQQEMDLRETLASLTLVDRAIVSLILAGFDYRDISAVAREMPAMSPATITRRLQRLRGQWQ